MSRRKPYKKAKRGGGSFVMLDSWLLKSDAWRGLSPLGRSLYIELKMRFNGVNNGEIFLSHRDAAIALNVSRPTAAKGFFELLESGFIKETRGACLGTEGRGQAAHFALTELPVNGKPASREFMRANPPNHQGQSRARSKAS